MNNREKVSAAVWESIRLQAQTLSGHPWHVQVSGVTNNLGIQEQDVREALIALNNCGVISLKTWSNSAGREISFSEWPTEDFFYNRDDAYYVRVKPLTLSHGALKSSSR
jgi:hypothetical protein